MAALAPMPTSKVSDRHGRELGIFGHQPQAVAQILKERAHRFTLWLSIWLASVQKLDAILRFG